MADQTALGPPAAGVLGLLLLGTAFIACGLAASTLTENQVVAAMVTYGILVFFWFMTWNEAVGSEFTAAPRRTRAAAASRLPNTRAVSSGSAHQPSPRGSIEAPLATSTSTRGT